MNQTVKKLDGNIASFFLKKIDSPHERRRRRRNSFEFMTRDNRIFITIH